MEELSGLTTITGKPVYSYEYSEHVRETEADLTPPKAYMPQKGPQEDNLRSQVDILITGGNRGGGKANPYSTLVITPSGWRRMGDLEVGDLICTPYNGVQTVTGIYEQGEKITYMLRFDDGTSVRCTDEHRFWARRGAFGPFGEMTAREIFGNYRIDSHANSKLRTGGEHVEIPLCGEVVMNERKTELNVPIHPLAFGYICGKGCWHFTSMGALVGKVDPSHARVLYMLGYMPRKSPRNGLYYLRNITDEDRRKITTSRMEQQARIPKEYLTSSISCRRILLKTIMSAAGVRRKLHPFLELMNRPYAEDVAQLARSLGIWARVAEITDNPERIGWWRVMFVAPDDGLLYKAATCRPKSLVNGTLPTTPNSKDVLSKKILSVCKIKEKSPCRCITVSGRDHLYMTDAFTINHNTFTLLMDAMYDIGNKGFNGIIFRKNKDDFNNIIRDSKLLYSDFGRYNRSKEDMTWYFDTGATLTLSIFDKPYPEFTAKYRGQQFAYIGVDELPQMPFEKFKFLMTANRNVAGIKSRILGTCNPDPLSWLRMFIDWWIGKDGLPIPERDGAVRYCYMKEDSVESTVWGNTPEEVYRQCREDIDKYWDPAYEEMGYDKVTFAVKSVTFIKADLKYNKKLLASDVGYIAGLNNQSEEVKQRDLAGNWNYMETGGDMINMLHLERCFRNDQMLGDRIRRATCDVACDGGDNCVTWLWIGWHLADIFVCSNGLIDTCRMVKAKLDEWGVLEKDFVFDLNGLGQAFKDYFREAVPFNNQEAAAPKYRNIYDNIKSQCANMFAQKVRRAEISFDPEMLTRRFSGRGFDGRPLRDILQQERKCIRQDASKRDRGWCLIKKDQMKRLVGHSPDFFESLMMRMKFEVAKGPVEIPAWARPRNGMSRPMSPKGYGGSGFGGRRIL